MIRNIEESVLKTNILNKSTGPLKYPFYELLKLKGINILNKKGILVKQY